MPCVPQWPFGDVGRVLEGIAEDGDDDKDIGGTLEGADVPAVIETDCWEDDITGAFDELMMFELDIWPCEEDAATRDELLLPT